MTKIVLSDSRLLVGDAAFPIIFTPGHAKAFDSVEWTHSPKFSEKWQPYRDVVRSLFDDISDEAWSEICECTLRFHINGRTTPYLVHYGERASDSSGCLLIGYPGTVSPNYELFMQTVRSAHGYKRWDARALYLNYLVYRSLTKE